MAHVCPNVERTLWFNRVSGGHGETPGFDDETAITKPISAKNLAIHGQRAVPLISIGGCVRPQAETPLFLRGQVLSCA